MCGHLNHNLAYQGESGKLKQFQAQFSYKKKRIIGNVDLFLSYRFKLHCLR